jgi:hypothetical protein
VVPLVRQITRLRISLAFQKLHRVDIAVGVEARRQEYVFNMPGRQTMTVGIAEMDDELLGVTREFVIAAQPVV